MSLVDTVPGARARASSTPKQVLAVWCSVAALVALWSFSRGWMLAATASGLAALLLGLSALRPAAPMKSFAGKIARFSDVAAEHLSLIVLGLWYYLFFTPVALLWRALRRPLPEENGMWKEFRPQGVCSFRKPF